MANTWNQSGTTWGSNQWGEQGPTTVTLTGQNATSSVGSPTLKIDVNVGLTGLLTTSSVGSIIIQEGIPLTGLSATSSVGSITPIQQVMGLTGLAATSAVGSIYLLM